MKTKFVSVPTDLYILKSDLIKLDKGDSAIGYIKVSDPNNYELINKYAFQPAIKINSNEYDVCLIFK